MGSRCDLVLMTAGRVTWGSCWAVEGRGDDLGCFAGQETKISYSSRCAGGIGGMGDMDY